MINQFIRISKKPYFLFLSLIIFFFLIPLLISFLFGTTFINRIVYFVLSLLFTIFIAELIFLFLYRFASGNNYQFIKKIDFKKIAYEPHPYVPFILKKNFKRVHGASINYYPLNKHLKFPELISNNIGYYNGENGDRDILIPKPKNMIRINCLGGSTTGNYIKDENGNCSYPLELEKILKKKFKKEIEVNNFGQGGYNSADLLVRFSLQTIDTKPDYVIIYHAYNDIRAYLSPNFSSDYFHSRKNLGEVYWKFYLGSKLPSIPINFINYLSNKFLFPIDVRSTLLEVIEKKKLSIDQDYSQGLLTYERNIQHIIDLCKNNNIKVILSTFCYYLYEDIKDDPIHKLYQEIVSRENDVMKKLSDKNELIFVDASNLIQRIDENFVDSAHFTPKGMRLLAECLAEKI
jgi:lysophospholipase L1-like esterase